MKNLPEELLIPLNQDEEHNVDKEETNEDLVALWREQDDGNPLAAIN